MINHISNGKMNLAKPMQYIVYRFIYYEIVQNMAQSNFIEIYDI